MNRTSLIGNFHIDGQLFRYADFVPRLYNFCLSLGMRKGRMLPSRAYCSDESQGYPIILLAKHFGTFPFNHGRVGGIVAVDRHGPHAEHSQDSLIIQASHVGYDPETRTFGTYRRLQCEHHDATSSCGKIDRVIDWYRNEYQFAQDNIFIERRGRDYLVTIDNQLLNERRSEGLFLNLNRIVTPDEHGVVHFETAFSTSKCFVASPGFRTLLKLFDPSADGRHRIGKHLLPELFTFKRQIHDDSYGPNQLELNLFDTMHLVVTSDAPLLTAAQINTQVEFDRNFRTIVKEHAYRGRRLLYIAGLNIDISPQVSQLFPITKFVPWAAYIQRDDGSNETLEQHELVARLRGMSNDNPDQINLDDAIEAMRHVPDIVIPEKKVGGHLNAPQITPEMARK